MVSGKVFLIVALVVVSVLARTPRVIYNGDSRVDFYQASSSLQNLGASGVLIVSGATGFTHNSDGTWSLTGSSTAENAFSLCPEERFSQQLIANGASYCSGFLLSTNPPWIGTAGHCAGSGAVGSVVLFDYVQLDVNTTKTKYPANDYYTVASVVAAGPDLNDGNDWGVLQLDRVVVGRTPYTSINKNPTVGAALTLIGHPIGLPKKYDPQGVVTLTPSTGVVNAFVDSYGGNSGSPVFDVNGKLVGILVSGAQDFVSNPAENNCQISNNCPGGPTCDSTGETITSICQLGNDARLASLNLCKNSNVNASSTSSPSVAASSQPSASTTPAPSTTPSSAPNAASDSQALVTYAYLDCNGNCTDFSSLEKEIATYLKINTTNVQIVPISRDRTSAYVQITVCANSTVLVTFANAVLSGDLDLGITQDGEIVIRDAQYQSSCPLTPVNGTANNNAGSTLKCFSLFTITITVLLAVLVAF